MTLNLKECDITNINTTKNEKIIIDIYKKILNNKIKIDINNEKNDSFKSNMNSLFDNNNRKNNYIDQIIKNTIYTYILTNEKVFTVNNKEDCIKKIIAKKSKKIGSGFFGTTYKISETRAVKVARLNLWQLNKEPINDLNLIQEIKKEYLILKKLNGTHLSPNTHNLSFCITNNEIYMMIEMDYLNKYIEAVEFFRQLKKKDKKNFSKIKQKIYDAMNIMMKKLDKLGIYHGDLHLSNIMIHKNTHDIKFIDFGIANNKPPKNKLRDYRFNKNIFNIDKISDYIYKYLIENFNIYIIQSPNNINKLLIYEKDKK